jgi:membrane protease YdiL (CAAX protease family)
MRPITSPGPRSSSMAECCSIQVSEREGDMTETLQMDSLETGAANVPRPPARPPRKEAFLEVSVFLFLIAPSMVLSYFVSRQGTASFVFLAVSTIFRDLSLVSLILFFLWRNGEPVRVIGWRSRHLERNIFLGVLLYFPLVFVIGLAEQLLRAAGLSAPSEPAPALFSVQGRAEVVLAVVLIAVVAISEETIFRGYLTTRLATATRSTTVAVLLSAIVFALGHGYEGSLGVVTVGIMGLVFNLIYLWRKSLVTPITMHFLQDFIAIIALRYLQGAS